MEDVFITITAMRQIIRRFIFFAFAGQVRQAQCVFGLPSSTCHKGQEHLSTNHHVDSLELLFNGACSKQHVDIRSTLASWKLLATLLLAFSLRAGCRPPVNLPVDNFAFISSSQSVLTGKTCLSHYTPVAPKLPGMMASGGQLDEVNPDLSAMLLSRSASAMDGSIEIARWTLQVSIGREAGTSMPADWAKSGARLPFSIDMNVTSMPAAMMDVEAKVGSTAYAIEPRVPFISITGFSGSVQIPVRGGGWRVQDNLLTFWLDFPEGSTRGDSAGDTSNVWDLAPGVATSAMDVVLPEGRFLFETMIFPDEKLQQLNQDYLAARADSWKAKEAVKLMEKAKDPTPVWSATEKAWVKNVVDEDFVTQAMRRTKLLKTEQALKQADNRRPKRSELSQEAGPWPGVGDAVWVMRKGKVSLKRSGPFGIGSTYATLGTWSAEPMDPVETFWTMPP